MALINKLANFLLNVNDVIVENIDFGLSRHEERILTFDLRPYKRLQRICPHCGRRCPGYDRGNRPARTWRALYPSPPLRTPFAGAEPPHCPG